MVSLELDFPACFPSVMSQHRLGIRLYTPEIRLTVAGGLRVWVCNLIPTEGCVWGVNAA